MTNYPAPECIYYRVELVPIAQLRNLNEYMEPLQTSVAYCQHVCNESRECNKQSCPIDGPRCD